MKYKEKNSPYVVVSRMNRNNNSKNKTKNKKRNKVFNDDQYIREHESNGPHTHAQDILFTIKKKLDIKQAKKPKLK